MKENVLGFLENFHEIEYSLSTKTILIFNRNISLIDNETKIKSYYFLICLNWILGSCKSTI